jgi:RimJ/RimL family protein N-acetyltransferase
LLGEQIYTRRLLLRRIRERDLPLIHAWSNSEVAYGPYLTPERLTVRALDELFAGNTFWNRHNRKFLVENRQTGQAIGTIHHWLRPGQTETAVMCVKIAEPDERGQGYGTEAQKYLIIHLFEQVAVNAVEMYTDVNNLPQQRCLAKLGFSMAESLTYDDRHVTRPGLLFQLTRADFLQKAIYRFHYE